MSPPFDLRQKIAQDTITRSAQITSVVSGASLSSTFIPAQLPALDPSQCPNLHRDVRVVNSDSFTVARNLFTEETDALGKVAVLNFASDERRAGGWIQSLSMTQVRLFRYILFPDSSNILIPAYRRKKHSVIHPHSMKHSDRLTTLGPTSVRAQLQVSSRLGS